MHEKLQALLDSTTLIPAIFSIQRVTRVIVALANRKLSGEMGMKLIIGAWMPWAAVRSVATSVMAYLMNSPAVGEGGAK